MFAHKKSVVSLCKRQLCYTTFCVDIRRKNNLKGDESMPNLNDFYAFNSTSRNSSGGNNNGNGGGTGCGTVLIVSAIIGWVLWLVGNFFG